MKQLEVKFYSRQEMAQELALDQKDKNFTRKVSSVLSNWGYDVTLIPRKGFEITRQPQTAKERLNEIMVRCYGLDIQLDTYAFALFLTLLLQDEEFSSQPWEEREKNLSEFIGYTVNEKTLRKWGSILLKHGTIVKDTQKKTYWRTSHICGEKVREQVEIDDEERTQYWKEFWQLKASGCENISKELWHKYGCCYYSCCSYIGSAWDDNEKEVLEDVMELTQEIAGMEPTETVVEQTCRMIDVPVATERISDYKDYFGSNPSNSKTEFQF